MKILAIGFVFNERPYLPELIEYYQDQGCDLYLIDNCSTDGTFEYLKSRNIPCHQFDTQECFYLNWLQSETNKIIHEIEPDWVVYIAGDLYHIFETDIKTEIEHAELNGYNQIRCNGFEFFNIGETRSLPLQKNYFYGKEYRPLVLISKYHKSLRLNGDDIHIENRKEYWSNGLYLNYGNCKSAPEQELKLLRSYNAWEKRMSRGYNEHYPIRKLKNWVMPMHEVIHYSEFDCLGLIEEFISK